MTKGRREQPRRPSSRLEDEFHSLTPYECVGTDGDPWPMLEMLDNPEADRAIARIAIERAVVERGITHAMAVRLYGIEGENYDEL